MVVTTSLLLKKPFRWRRCTLVALVVCIVVIALWRDRVNIGVLPVPFTATLSELTTNMINHNSSNSNSNSSVRNDGNHTDDNHTHMMAPFVSSITLEQGAVQESNATALIKEDMLKNITIHQNKSNSAIVASSVDKNATQNETEQEQVEELPRPHPHAGAKDEYGQWGYIHDPLYVKNYPLPFTHDLGDGRPICQTPFGLDEESTAGYEALKLITVANDSNPFEHNTTHTSTFSTATTDVLVWPKLLCIIYTHSNRHDTLVQTVVETYAPQCDGFMAASNQTNRTLGAVHIPHEGTESYKEMWNKVRSIWSYVHDHFSNDFDYFHIGGDDMYVIPQNLRHFAATISNSTSSFQYLGGIMGGNSWKTFCGGGSGYTFNRATLKLLVEKLLPRCGVRLRTSQEDIMVANCFLRYSRQCHCNDTRDDRFATRYHQMSAEWQMKWDGDNRNVMANFRLRERYNFSYLPGASGLSRNSISFHVKRPTILLTQRIMKRYHVILFPSICQDWNQQEHTNASDRNATISL